MFRFADGFNTLNVSLEAWNKSDYFFFSPYTPKKKKSAEVFKQPNKFPFAFLICNYICNSFTVNGKF